MSAVLEVARGYVDAGLSVLPVALDGSKRPAIDVLPRVPDPKQPDRMKATWKPLESRRPTADELLVWYGKSTPRGIALVCGPISGGAECIDLDDKETAREFIRLVRAAEPDLLVKLSLESTPRGLHLWFKSPVSEGNTILAQRPDGFDGDGKPKVKTIIETRGVGGYAVVEGSPLDVHELKLPYKHVGGPPLTALSPITTEDRDYLFNLARCFHREDPRTEKEHAANYRPSGDLTPGDDFDLRGEPFSEILTDAQFSNPGEDAGTVCRPGKDRGTSATVGHCRGKKGEPLLRVFTTNWHPFESGKAYGRFRTLGMVKFNGDLSATAKHLAGRGFGAAPKSSTASFGSTPPSGGQTDAAGQSESAAPSLILTPLSTLKAKPVHYLVPGRIPAGKLMLIGGRGGSGKSTLMRSLTADISAGRCALGLSYPNPVRGKVLIVAAEDGPSDTILPGLMAAGADLDRVAILEGVRANGARHEFTLRPEHVALVREQLRRSPDIKLVTIDPIASFVGRAKVDDHRSTELRLVLDPLSELAESSGATIAMIAHLNKANGDAVDRFAGSAAYRDAVRCAYLVSEDPEDETRRLFMPVKENLPGFTRTTVPYRLARLTPEELDPLMLQPQFAGLSPADLEAIRSQMGRVAFDNPITVDANSVTSARKGADKNKVEKCMEFIRSFLKQHAYPSSELLAAAKAASFTFDNVKSARERLTAEGVLCATKEGAFRGVWWVGLGAPSTWNVRPHSSSSAA